MSSQSELDAVLGLLDERGVPVHWFLRNLSRHYQRLSSEDNDAGRGEDFGEVAKSLSVAAHLLAPWV